MPRWPKYVLAGFLPLLLVAATLMATRLSPAAPTQTGTLDRRGAPSSGRLAPGGRLPEWYDEKLDQFAARIEASVDAILAAHLAGTAKAVKQESRPGAKASAAIGRAKRQPEHKPKALGTSADAKTEETLSMPQVLSAQGHAEGDAAYAGVAREVLAESSAPLDLEPLSPLAERPQAMTGGRCTGSMVQAAPKEWCGRAKSAQAACLSQYETAYMEQHAEELRRGLEALRAPGCFPHGITVATMGYFRTGSTLLFNVARLWAGLGSGESLVAGFGCKDPVSLGVGIAGSETAACSMVCKDHEWKYGVATHAAVALMSRRDPWESVCSRKLMDLWCRIRQAGRRSQAPASEKAEYERRCRSEPAVEALEAQNQCKDLMLMQAKIYHTRRSRGGSIAYDVLLSDYELSPARQVREVARAMGICSEAYDDPALVKMVVAMGTELKKHPDHDMGVTQMHDVHTDKQRRAKCGMLAEWMREDRECREWMDANASSTANALLRRMDEDAALGRTKGKD